MINKIHEIFNSNVLFDYYLNFSDYSVTDKNIIFESRFSTFYKESIIYIDDKILTALSTLKPEHIQLLKSRLVYRRKLQEIANDNQLTRERVRQIESQNIKKFLAVVDRSIIINITNLLSEQSILFLDDIPIKDKELKLLFCEIISYKKSRKALFDKELMALVKDSIFSYTGVLNKIEHYITQKDEALFSKNSLIDTLQILFPKVKNVENLIPSLMRKEKLRIVNEEQYFFPFIYKPKRPMLEFVFSLYPEGLELHKEVAFIMGELNKYFPGIFKDKDKKRAITGLVGSSDDVLLWDWGKYLHVKYIYPILEEYDFSSVLDYIDEHLNDTQIDLESCFKAYEEELVNIGITSKYALHTSLKLKYPEDYSYQDSPWISKSGTERRELKQTLKNLMVENRNYSLDELVNLMHTNKVRLQQLIDNTTDIIQVNSFQYKRKEFLSFPEELLDDIIQYVNKKVEELDFIYVELIENAYKNELSHYRNHDVRMLILELLKKYPNKKNFKISNTRIINKDYPLTKDSLNFHRLIENLLKDKITITINEIADFFIKRGLAQNRIMMYYYASKLKRIVRLNKENFMSIEKIGLTEKDIEKINLLLENNLTSETHIDDILRNYKLPMITVEWSRFILTDLTDHVKFRFHPSRENPIYIEFKTPAT